MRVPPLRRQFQQFLFFCWIFMPRKKKYIKGLVKIYRVPAPRPGYPTNLDPSLIGKTEKTWIHFRVTSTYSQITYILGQPTLDAIWCILAKSKSTRKQVRLCSNYQLLPDMGLNPVVYRWNYPVESLVNEKSTISYIKPAERNGEIVSDFSYTPPRG